MNNESELVLECNKCNANLFLISTLGTKKYIKCSGCGTKQEMDGKE